MVVSGTVSSSNFCLPAGAVLQQKLEAPGPQSSVSAAALPWLCLWNSICNSFCFFFFFFYGKERLWRKEETQISVPSQWMGLWFNKYAFFETITLDSSLCQTNGRGCPKCWEVLATILYLSKKTWSIQSGQTVLSAPASLSSRWTWITQVRSFTPSRQGLFILPYLPLVLPYKTVRKTPLEPNVTCCD